MNVANRLFTSDGAYYYSRRYSGDTMMHGSQYKFLLAGAILVLLTVLSFSAPSRAATFQVDANCSLAEAIGLANSNLPPLVSAPGIRTCAVQGDIFVRDIIILPSNTQLNFTSPHLGGGKNALPVITSSIKIIGNGSTLNRRSGFFRFIEVSNGGDLILESLTLSNAAHDYNGGAIYN